MVGDWLSCAYRDRSAIWTGVEQVAVLIRNAGGALRKERFDELAVDADGVVYSLSSSSISSILCLPLQIRQEPFVRYHKQDLVV